jgi:hypothetical protein
LNIYSAFKNVGALCIFGEIIKKSGNDKSLKPKPHLFFSMMRAFASKGDFDSVKQFNSRMWFDSAGSIGLSVRSEANMLLMEAAINSNQVFFQWEILMLYVVFSYS